MFALESPDVEGLSQQLNVPKFRVKQIREWIYTHYVDCFHDMTNLPHGLREELTAKFSVTKSKILKVKETGDGTTKLLLGFPDGAQIETVIMAYRDWSSACLSTQVGCSMGCVFCATGPMGIERNLTKEELVEQLWHCYRYTVKNKLKPLRNMVLMGIGEPLANLENVLGLIKVANDRQLFDMGQRRMALSTVGLVPQIDKLAQENLSITLAVSLHAPNDRLRNQLIPISCQYPLQELIAACRNYTDITGRRVTFEYLLLDGVNDGDSHARELVRLLKGLNCLVNLIPFNKIQGSNLRPSPRVKSFHRLLDQAGLNVTIRRSLGGSIEAACGQLRKGTGV